jgi:hypothetical protein
LSDTLKNRIAICCHGFLGAPIMLHEVVSTLNEEPFDKIYDNVFNISYYSSKYGVNFSQPYDIKTSIYDEKTTQTLAHHFYTKICTELKNYDEKVSLDIFAHSMGGLVTRSMVKYLAKEKNNSLWIKNGRIDKIFLLGTPNYGTRLAQRSINIPMDILITGLNLIFELPDGVTSDDLQLFKSQFMQMVPNSVFLNRLNQRSKNIEKSITWVTVRGLKWIKQLGWLPVVWQPFLFRKLWIDQHFPFIHVGVIPNDGLVDAKRVPLKFATNLTVPSATHMDLLNWKSKKSGQEVLRLIKPIIIDDTK